MRLVISQNAIGAESHLSYDGTTWSWVRDFSNEDLLWGFSNSCRSLEDSAAACHLKAFSFKDTPWGIAQSQVQKNGNPRWQHLVPFDMWKRCISSLASQLWLHFKDPDNSYYITTFLRNRELSWNLSRPAIHKEMLEKKIELSKDAQSSVLKKFLPDSEGLAPRSTYSFSKTVTGRMTIVSGPNVLTLKKENRGIFKSKYKSGKILEIDLQSAEPRVALSLFGKSIEGDVYGDVLGSLGLEVTRDAIKIATLSALYGASHHTLKSHLPESVSAFSVLEKVRDYFGVRHIEKMLKDQHEELGHITNTHGRKIFSEFPSLNHMIQSSAVDAAFDVFDLMLGKIKLEGVAAIPIYFIHDAIILDVSSEDVGKVRKICEGGFMSPVTKTVFPVKIKEIN